MLKLFAIIGVALCKKYITQKLKSTFHKYHPNSVSCPMVKRTCKIVDLLTFGIAVVLITSSLFPKWYHYRIFILLGLFRTPTTVFTINVMQNNAAGKRVSMDLTSNT